MVTTLRTEHTESYESWCELRFRRQTCGWNFQDFIGCLQYYKRGVKRIFHGKSFLKPEERRKKSLTQQYIDDFRIKVTGQEQEVGSLSGGNQQKVVIGHALATNRS